MGGLEELMKDLNVSSFRKIVVIRGQYGKVVI